MSAEICDFCAQPNPKWAYPCRDYGLQVVIAGRDLSATHASRGAWAACEPCSTLIERGARDELLIRCLDEQPVPDGIEVSIVKAFRGELEAYLVQLHGRFFEFRGKRHVIGPADEFQAHVDRTVAREQCGLAYERGDRVLESCTNKAGLEARVDRDEVDWVPLCFGCARHVLEVDDDFAFFTVTDGRANDRIRPLRKGI